MCLCPLQFSRLSLHFEVFVAFGAAEAKYTSIVADKRDAFGGVDRSRAEMTSFNPISELEQGFRKTIAVPASSFLREALRPVCTFESLR
jgi:hypothetical protein